MEKNVIEQLKIMCKEIIELCDGCIALNESPNIPVIEIVKREFELIQETLLNEEKVIVLTKNKDLWASRTIIDSADYKDDPDLFDKVFKFEKACKKLPMKNLSVKY